jgi:two-component sensor histidine kinase
LEHHALALILAALIGLFIAVTSEAFRKLLDRSFQTGEGKDLLLRELAHRVKNNLAMVSSLLYLQARRKPELKEDFEDAAHRVQVMADVHDFLRERTSGDIVDLGAYLHELCAKLGDTLRGVRPIAVNVQVQYVEVPATVAVPVGLIVNELVTNSLKYAFPEESNGAVNIACTMDGVLTVIVEDNGIGTTTNRSGMGSTLIKLMTNQLQGNINHENADPGFRTILRIPLH